jgi:seryl-tRNA synthetase
MRIDEERGRSIERNEVFMGVMEELQNSHNAKMEELGKEVESMGEERKEIGSAGERVRSIKSNIEDILKQSWELKTDNERLQK